MPRIGVLTSASPESDRGRALREGLREFGYVEGQNIAFEWRESGGRADRFPDFAAELVSLNVNVIVAADNPAIAAAQKATKTTPIVMVLATDPVGTGFHCQPRAARGQHHGDDNAGSRVARQTPATP
ncbi:MAG: hypothetical protein EXR33_03965 [Betaproteobacteria bacterium]|nr:hypothetical protein [Betaproteobacteria bacterium]